MRIDFRNTGGDQESREASDPESSFKAGDRSVSRWKKVIKNLQRDPISTAHSGVLTDLQISEGHCTIPTIPDFKSLFPFSLDSEVDSGIPIGIQYD